MSIMRDEVPEEEVTPFDPREFTGPEWAIIQEALLQASKRNAWLAQKPGIGHRAAEDLERSAERRRDLAFKAMRAKRYGQP